MPSVKAVVSLVTSTQTFLQLGQWVWQLAVSFTSETLLMDLGGPITSLATMVDTVSHYLIPLLQKALESASWAHLCAQKEACTGTDQQVCHGILRVDSMVTHLVSKEALDKFFATMPPTIQVNIQA